MRRVKGIPIARNVNKYYAVLQATQIWSLYATSTLHSIPNQPDLPPELKLSRPWFVQWCNEGNREV